MQEELIEEQVEYQGRKVSKEHFRVFMFGIGGTKKLISGYEHYLDALKSGLLFDSIKDRDDFLKKNTEDKGEDTPKARRNKDV